MEVFEISKLEKIVSSMWDDILKNSDFIQTVLDGKATKELYAIYMIETYHYTKHNARNQALVGAVANNISGKYQAYCFDHAHEEAGHELMALSDIGSIGFDKHKVLSLKPLAATETLIAYLYWISITGNPVQRLGYSFWAESVYKYINPVLISLKETIDLKDKDMKFFVAHSAIDAKHAEEVNEMLEHACTTEDDVSSVISVMENSLKLTARILDDVYEEYQKYISGASKRYVFLGK